MTEPQVQEYTNASPPQENSEVGTKGLNFINQPEQSETGGLNELGRRLNGDAAGVC